MKFLEKSALFVLGGGAYVGLELFWRGRSHISMFLAGGTSLLLLGQLNRAKPRLPLPLRAAVGAGIITMVELAAGLLFNRDHSVWDYRGLPAQFMGQISLQFALLWLPLAFLGIQLYRGVESKLP